MPAENKKTKKSKAKSDNDVYTAMLGLTVLVLGTTAVTVCLRSLELFDSIFTLTY
jgi:hypothetical protein